MRPSLLPGLLAAARRNLDRGAASVRLFEIGRRYLADGRAADGRAAAGRRDARRAAGRPARRSGFDASTPRPKRWRCSRRPARRSTICSCSWAPGETWHPGPLGDARARAQDHARRVRRASSARRQGARPRRPGRSPPRSTSTRSRRRARASGRAPAYRAAGAAGGDARLRLPRPGRPGRRRAGPRGPRRRQGGDRRRAPVRPLSRASEGQSLAVEVTLQPGEKSFTEAEIAEMSTKIVAAAAKLGAQLAGGSSALIAAWTRASISLALQARRDDLADLEVNRCRLA